MKKIDLLETPPKREVLIAWLNEAAIGGVTPTGMRRLCLEAARALAAPMTDGLAGLNADMAGFAAHGVEQKPK